MGIETVMALVILEKAFMKSSIRNYKGISTENTTSLLMNLQGFMENILKFDKVREAFVKEFYPTTTEKGSVLNITNYFRVKTETAGLDLIIEKII